ncbi:MAG: NADH-quinone oxidoreductase subunit A [Cytophagales bacterium]|nr:NADH-quinone oxidoreductase subunit A [Bernardetiaceae bacterium]MDW8205363.1 NADH-quinone oxidoreductase subunit A [Cytophagales bacterium]
MDLLVPVLFFIGGSLVFVSIAFGVWRLLRPHRPDSRKLTAYECGEEPIGSAQGLFNSRFYIVAIVFLLFEAELLFLFPWAVAAFHTNKQPLPTLPAIWISVEIGIFVAILTLGLAYVWQQGHFNWGKTQYLPPITRKSPIPRSVYEAFNKRQ